MADATPGRPVLPASLSHDPGRWTRRPPAELPLNSYRTFDRRALVAILEEQA